MFKKAGYPYLLAFLPVVNTVLVLRIVGRPAQWVLLALVPLVDVVVYFVVARDLARSFGKSAWFGTGLALLPIVFVPILGVGKATYKGALAETST